MGNIEWVIGGVVSVGGALYLQLAGKKLDRDLFIQFQKQHHTNNTLFRESIQSDISEIKTSVGKIYDKLDLKEDKK